MLVNLTFIIIANLLRLHYSLCPLQLHVPFFCCHQSCFLEQSLTKAVTYIVISTLNQHLRTEQFHWLYDHIYTLVFNIPLFCSFHFLLNYYIHILIILILFYIVLLLKHLYPRLLYIFTFIHSLVVNIYVRTFMCVSWYINWVYM